MEAAAKKEESNKLLAEIYTLMGKTTAEKSLKSIINVEQMKKVWTKIGHADQKKEPGSISLLQVMITWPDADIDTSTVTQLDNPKEAEYLKAVETHKEIATYLKLCI
eukprot:10988828-Ditylum_brightwellii.AAC.1